MAVIRRELSLSCIYYSITICLILKLSSTPPLHRGRVELIACVHTDSITVAHILIDGMPEHTVADLIRGATVYAAPLYGVVEAFLRRLFHFSAILCHAMAALFGRLS